MAEQQKRGPIIEVLLIAVSLVLYGIPFLFIIINSLKDRRSAGMMNLSWPEQTQFLANYAEVFTTRDFMVLRSFKNSIIITVVSIVILIIICALAGYILQRRSSRTVTLINFLFLSGLMLPPAIIPTIWVMDGIGIYRSLFGMILVEVALNTPFTVMLYRGFTASIPQDIEEAAVIDGTTSLGLFRTIIMPLLKPVTATVIVLNAVTIFNDFVNPLYFLPGAKNATVQLTLYNFMGQFGNSWNLLFADVVIITIAPLLLFIFFNRRIVEGMTAGAVKG
jgi:raffinose/stachyose/melibiose transport system permease protein